MSLIDNRAFSFYAYITTIYTNKAVKLVIINLIFLYHFYIRYFSTVVNYVSMIRFDMSSDKTTK